MVLIIIGAFFKLMHWPGSSALILLGLTGQAIGLALGLIMFSKTKK